MAGASDGGRGRRDGRGREHQSSPPRASGLIERCTRGASLVPLMLLSAAAADTLHAPADINLSRGCPAYARRAPCPCLRRSEKNPFYGPLP
eukprot:1181145-Prymnesium_polylepis.1